LQDAAEVAVLVGHAYRLAELLARVPRAEQILGMFGDAEGRAAQIRDFIWQTRQSFL
jgi:hypothetical protein